jgi:hypothetical protein
METITAEYIPATCRLLIKKNGKVSRDISAVDKMSVADSIIQGVGFMRCFEWKKIGITYTCQLKIK